MASRRGFLKALAAIPFVGAAVKAERPSELVPDWSKESEAHYIDAAGVNLPAIPEWECGAFYMKGDIVTINGSLHICGKSGTLYTKSEQFERLT